MVKNRIAVACIGLTSLFALSACDGGSGDSAAGDTGGVHNFNPPPIYSVGGTVTGLAGSNLQLELGFGAYSYITVSADGSFTFTQKLSSGTHYAVVVASHPAKQLCNVTNGTGTMPNGDVASVTVNCIAGYTVGGSVAGLTGTGLELQNNSGQLLSIKADGAFTFPQPIQSGGSFNVSVRTQPTSQPVQLCDLSNASGTSTTPVTNVMVNCRTAIGRFLYVVNTESKDISGFSINPRARDLTPVSESPFASAGTTPRSAIAHPSGRYMYVAGSAGGSSTAGSMTGYTIDAATGTLTPIASAQLNFPLAVARLAIHPNGRTLYFHTMGGPDDAVYIHFMHSFTGALTPVSGSPFLMRANGAAFDSTGKFYFVATPSSGVIAFAADPATGALSQTSQLPYPGGVSATPLTPIVDPTGNYLYVTGSPSSVAGFGTTSPNGLTSAIPGSPYPTGLMPTADFFIKSHLYILNSSSLSPSTPTPGSISVYSQNVSDGSLAPVAGSPFSTGGTGSNFVTPDPTNKFLFITNTGTGTVSVLATNTATGTLTPIQGSPFTLAIGTTPGAVKFDADGRFFYVTDSGTNSVSLYSFDPTTGVPTYVSSYAVGLAPSGEAPIIVGIQ